MIQSLTKQQAFSTWCNSGFGSYQWRSNQPSNEEMRLNFLDLSAMEHSYGTLCWIGRIFEKDSDLCG